MPRPRAALLRPGGNRLERATCLSDALRKELDARRDYVALRIGASSIHFGKPAELHVHLHAHFTPKDCDHDWQ